MSQTCKHVARVAGTQHFVECNLPVGHGGNHAARVEKERKEVTKCVSPPALDYPTTVFETTHVWGSAQEIATSHLTRQS